MLWDLAESVLFDDFVDFFEGESFFADYFFGVMLVWLDLFELEAVFNSTDFLLDFYGVEF